MIANSEMSAQFTCKPAVYVKEAPDGGMAVGLHDHLQNILMTFIFKDAEELWAVIEEIRAHVMDLEREDNVVTELEDEDEELGVRAGRQSHGGDSETSNQDV